MTLSTKTRNAPAALPSLDMRNRLAALAEYLFDLSDEIESVFDTLLQSGVSEMAIMAAMENVMKRRAETPGPCLEE
jgi:hypothetical protein